jgi:D-beta-D-heptose 7-phosphate kinase/D-beta-D-heptose 1-phosphate adenosyltransferase
LKKYLTLTTLRKKLKNTRKKVVFTNGCFDILHAGHVRYLSAARAMGDMLVVGLNSDASVKRIKGAGRPIVPEPERAEILSALESIDYIVAFSEPTPIKLIEAIKPKVLVKGADWKHGEIVGEDFVKKNKGTVKRIRLVKGRSTTNIIKKVRKLKSI